MPHASPAFEDVLAKPIGILYEHPLWFEPLFAELDRRGFPYERVRRTATCSIPTRARARTRSS